MTTTKVVPDPDGIAELMRSEELRAGMTKMAEPVLSKAKATAPVLTGEYRDGLHIEQAKGPDGVVQVLIGDNSDHGIYVEAQSGNLKKALDAVRSA